MTSLPGLQPAHGGQGTRESSREPVDAARAQEIYAAWKAIFENARPAQSAPARSRPEQTPATTEPGAARPTTFAFGNPQTAQLRVDAADSVMLTAPDPAQTSLRAGVAAAESTATRASAPLPQTAAVPVAAMPRQIASAAVGDATSDVTVRIHYLRSGSARPVGASSVGELRPEVISIILEGAHVSIVVRDVGLTEAQALRTAFETARELTGRAASLQQLTLNGRVLYQQSNTMDVAQSADVLFAC